MAMFGAMPAVSAAAPGALGQMGAGMFGAGKPKLDVGSLIQSVIGGYMAGRGLPGGGALMGMANQRRQLAQQQELASQQRENDFQDYVRKESWKLANPGAVNNDTVNDYRFRESVLGADAAKDWLKNQGDPIVTVNLPGNRVYSGPRSQLGAALGAPAQGPQPGHVEDGFRFKGGNPADPNAWEQVNGGPTPQASGMFQPLGVGGETITSTFRTPEHNRRVGGKPNSFHLTGRARDSVPPKGMSMAAYYQQLRKLNPLLDVINEGDHVHIEPRGR